MYDQLTLNLGLRYDHQKHTPASKDDVAPRAGFAWNVGGTGNTVVRGGVGKFYAYVPVVLDLTLQQNGVRTLFPTITINAATDTCGVRAQARHDHRFSRAIRASRSSVPRLRRISTAA